MHYSKHIILCLAFVAMANASISFFYNNGGYDADLPKTIVLKSTSVTNGDEFKILKEGNTVYTGNVGVGIDPDSWNEGGESFFVADFSDFKEPGEYTIAMNDLGTERESNKFVIGNKQMSTATFSMVLDYFYNDRATNFATTAKVFPSGSTIDVSGGWYDASGDASKYLSHLSYANYLNPQQIPLTVWALAFTAEKNPSLLESMGKLESTKEEAAWGADFLVRMQSDEGYFYMTVFDNWGSSPTFYLCEFTGSNGEKSSSYQTAYRQGGGMAIAGLARAAAQNILGSYSSKEYLATAIKGFEHLESKQNIGGNCEYCNDGVENIIDDYTALLAAAELYNASKDIKYLEVARKRAAHLAGRIGDSGYFWSDEEKTRPFWHASDAGLPLVALVRYLELETDVKETSSIIAAAKKHLDWMLEVTEFYGGNPFGYARQTYMTQGAIKDGFFIPHDNESGYWWQGESARLGSLSAAAIYAARILKYDNMAGINKYTVDQLDWILGKNPYGISFMKGIGTKNPSNYVGQRLNRTLNGGIANGITGYNRDGSGIAWNNPAIYENSWDAWRFEEQWLPHSTWFLMALATRYDEIQTQAAVPADDIQIGSSSSKQENSSSSKDKSSSSKKPDSDDDGKDINDGSNVTEATFALATTSISFAQSNHSLLISGENLQGKKLHIFGVNGQLLKTVQLHAGTNTVELARAMKGVYIAKVEGISARKIVLK